MAFDVQIAKSTEAELGEITAFDRTRILDAIALLAHEPTRATKNRKLLPNLTPTFEHVPPVWELRVGAYRVFYDVDAAEQRVTIRAVRSKGRRTTGEIT